MTVCNSPGFIECSNLCVGGNRTENCHQSVREKVSLIRIDMIFQVLNTSLDTGGNLLALNGNILSGQKGTL